FSSLKTLLTLTEDNPRVGINVLDQLFSLAGFQVTTIGRFWVITEARTLSPVVVSVLHGQQMAHQPSLGHPHLGMVSGRKLGPDTRTVDGRLLGTEGTLEAPG